MKRKLIALGISGVLLGAGIVGAQENGSGGTEAESQETQTQAAETAETADTQRSAMLAHMLLRRPLDMGSTLTVTFYDGEPEAGGSELTSLEFVYGEDSEAAFAEELETAATDAAYVTVMTSPQTEAYNLSETQLEGPDGFSGMRGSQEGFGGHGPVGGFGGRHGGLGGRSY